MQISKKSLIAEHRELTKALRSKNPKLLKKELREQGEELKRLKKK